EDLLASAPYFSSEESHPEVPCVEPEIGDEFIEVFPLGTESADEEPLLTIFADGDGGLLLYVDVESVGAPVCFEVGRVSARVLWGVIVGCDVWKRRNPGV